jgi:uncharacterized protein (DUF885 family)
MRPLFFFLLIAPITFSCKTENEKQYTHGDSLDSLFREFYEFKKRINPIEATKAGFKEYNDQFANYVSAPYIQSVAREYQHFLKALENYSPEQVTPEQWMSLRVMKWDCELKYEGLTNSLVVIASPMFDLPNMELTPLLQIQSLHLYFAQLASGASVQPFQSVEDYDNWLKRVEGYLPFLDTCIVNMRQGMEQQVVLPQALIRKMIPQLEPFISAPLEQHLFYAPIVNLPEAFSDGEKQRLRNAFASLIKDRLVPKYTGLRDFLLNTYLPAGRETSGISDIPHGKETYRYLLRLLTTTNMTPEEIHELGLREVSRIRGEMEKIKEQVGFRGDLPAFFEYIRTSKEQMPYTDPQQVIDQFNAIHERMLPRLNQVFSSKPIAGFNVQRTEAFREASASAEYVPGSKDGKRPGTFYVPIPDVMNYNKHQDEALFLHEAVPGHHYQLSLQQENKNLPEFLHPESMAVFVEGWALYAESLGKELGLYEDPYQYFGMLSMEMHRAIRLVVDTGIHALGWTREQAIQYSLENEAESEASVIASIERYMATPGQATAYKIGQLKIVELRKKAEAQLGDRFSLPDFHDQVLNSGSLPLVLLEEKINNWLASQ